MKKVLFILTILCSVCSYATEITPVTKIGEIWSGYDDGRILFKTDMTHINPAKCGSNGFYVVDATHADAEKFLSILLTAQSRKADVQIRVSESLCVTGYPVALRMGIKP